MTELEYLRKLHAEATAGPWRVFTSADGLRLVGVGDKDGNGVLDSGFGVWAWTDIGIHNADTVVATRNALPDFIAAVRALSYARNLVGPDELIDAALAPFVKERK